MLNSPTPIEAATSLQDLYAKIYRELRPRAHMPQIRIRFYPYANIDSKIRLDTDTDEISVRISDLLEGAPPSVLEALGYILLGKLYAKPVARRFDRRYRVYVNSADIRRQALLIRRLRGRKPVSTPQGRCRNLDELFDELNARFFHGLLARPTLSWSRGASRQTLGYFDPAHNAIIISRVFDSEEVPLFLLEYVLYHEMLHLKYPTVYRSQRRCVHTPEFKRQEQLFPRYEEAVRRVQLL